MASKAHFTTFTATGDSSVATFGNPLGQHAVQVAITGAPSAVKVLLKGSVNGTDYYTIGTWDTAAGLVTGDIVPFAGLVSHLMATLDTLTGGTNPTVSVVVASSDGGAGSSTAALSASSSVIGKVGVDQTTEGTTNRVVAGDTTVVDVTLSLDTSAYASGDVLADTQVVTNAMRVADFGGVLKNLTLVDKDDQGAALDIYLLSANVVMGTENAAPSISDADSASILCRIPVGTSDYIDLGGVKVATLSGLDRAVKPASGTRSLYIAAVNGSGTPTYTAAGLVVRLGFTRT